MLRTYKAILVRDRVAWQGDAPNCDEPVEVDITVRESENGGSTRDRGRLMAEALQRIADRGGVADIADPVAWQRQARSDRPLPGREG